MVRPRVCSSDTVDDRGEGTAQLIYDQEQMRRAFLLQVPFYLHFTLFRPGSAPTLLTSKHQLMCNTTALTLKGLMDWSFLVRWLILARKSSFPKSTCE